MKLLNTLFEITIYSAVLFAAVTGFKLAFKSRLSPALHFTLWFLVIARLCIPVTVESGFHLFTVRAGEAGGEAELQVPDAGAPPMRATPSRHWRRGHVPMTPSGEAPAPASAAAAIRRRLAKALACLRSHGRTR